MRAVYAVCAFLQYAVHAGAHERCEKYRDASGVLRRVYGGCWYGRGVGAGSREGCNDDTRRDDGNCSLCEEMGRSFFFLSAGVEQSPERNGEAHYYLLERVSPPHEDATEEHRHG